MIAGSRSVPCGPLPAWETAERDIFLEVLRRERATTLLELGAATGFDAAFFKAHGFEVVCVDLSPQMVERCRARGLVAHVMDVADLRLPPDSFGAVYAMNCLVHVPKSQLRGVLEGISRVIKPGGLFYLGLYGVASSTVCGMTTTSSRSASSVTTRTRTYALE
jgi:SAM-dependent methyltransferase